MSFLPLFGVQILLYKIFSKNREFSSTLFVLFGFVSYLFFSSESIFFTFLLWEIITWISYLLLRNENNRKETRVILLNNIFGGLAFAWATCVLLKKVSLWSDLHNVDFSNADIIQISLGLSVAILTKSSQFPFSWLMLTKKSSSLVSAYLHSSTVVQMGIYLMVKIHSSALSSDLFFWIICISSCITIIQSSMYFNNNNLKVLIAITSQIHASLCILLALYDINCIRNIIIVHAIYKSFMFIYCDEIFRKNKSYNIRDVNSISFSSFLLLILCSIPMCGIPGFMASAVYGSKVFLQNKINYILMLIIKSFNILIFVKLFIQISNLIRSKKIEFFSYLHVLLLPCLLFLAPSGFIKTNYFILSILFSFLLSKFALKSESNFNVVKLFGSLIEMAKIPSKKDYIFYLSFLLIFIAAVGNFYECNVFDNFLMHFNVEDIIFYAFLIFGCFFLLQDGIFKKLSGFWLISIFTTNEYMKFGGVDIVVTNILADVIVSYLLIKSFMNFDHKDNNMIRFIRSVPINATISFCCISFFKISSKIVHYNSSISVNDIVVFYRILDTLGETLVLLIVGLCINFLIAKDRY
ncbi:hypothetical protein FZC35_00095 [Candidatus Cytomitobacter indipagum]|uniref:NADH:quinone oxidoreductase/Mrp antiporter membrane subunit domain-containing protein n=1 Tax=Candidatus Cytomitobacter indipagum TaxID=2601575 RepID=A0A5C0UCP9_9PROT|nr:hypothetical protein [Candidatus Cytomitobacter indipagum]QEK37796.1 hypothetical protein FZC35_00095 [Candidatus Cytomitobacter indipagum]